MMGIPFLIIVGSILHFVFDWTNRLPIVGIFSPVNESVWEHMKLGFWSLILFSLIEYGAIGKGSNNFMFAKALSILCLQACILITFYTYTQYTGKPILWIDISSYVVGSVICQIVSYNVLTKTVNHSFLAKVGLALILLQALVLIIFTFIPPKFPIFQDSHTLTYGIQNKKILGPSSRSSRLPPVKLQLIRQIRSRSISNALCLRCDSRYPLRSPRSVQGSFAQSS